MFAFMCFSSCVGSLNRRPCHVIFSLEQRSATAIIYCKSRNFRTHKFSTSAHEVVRDIGTVL